MSSIVTDIFDSRKLLHAERLPFYVFLLLFADVWVCATINVGIFALQTATAQPLLEIGSVAKLVTVFVGLAMLVGPLAVWSWDYLLTYMVCRSEWMSKLVMGQRGINDYPRLDSAYQFILVTDNQVAYGEYLRQRRSHKETKNSRTFVLLALGLYLFGYYVLDAEYIEGSVWHFWAIQSDARTVISFLLVNVTVFLSLWFVAVFLFTYAFAEPFMHLPGYAMWRAKKQECKPSVVRTGAQG